MSLEDEIKKLIPVIEENTKELKLARGAKPAAAAAAPAAATEKAKAKAAPTVDFDTLKAAGAKVMAAKGKPFGKKLVKDIGGATELASVKPEKFAALMAAFEKALEAEEEEEEEEEDAEL